MAGAPYLNILKLYNEIHLKRLGDRFMDEVYHYEVYKQARPQLTVVDLGAYEGEFSFYCLPFAKDIYAVEPDPRPFSVLQKTVYDFGLGNTVKLFDCAIAKEDGKRNMTFSGAGGNAFGEGEGEVDVYSLNNFFVQNGIEQIDVLKIDVEKAEEEIFSADDFPGNKIKFIVGEYHGTESSLDKLKKHGFALEFPGSGIFTARK
jgi:FkbM family methyltransferase